LSNPYVKD